MLYTEEFLKSLKPDHPLALLASRNKTAFEQIQQWFSELCPGGDAGMEARLRESDSSQFIAALYELLLHRYAHKRGWTALRDYKLNGKNPDFYFKEIDWMGEVFTIGSSDEEKREERQLDILCDALNKMHSDFWVNLYGYELKKAEIKTKDVIAWAEKQLAEGKTAAEFEATFEDENCRLEFYFHRKEEPAPKANVGVRGVEWLDYEMVKVRTRCRLKEKTQKYDREGIIFACSGHAEPCLDVEILEECLYYGEKRILLQRDGTGKLQARENRVFQGFFSKIVKGVPQNTRISAVVYSRYGIDPEGCFLELVPLHNPYARKPLALDIFSPVRQLAVTAKDEKGVSMTWVSDAAEPFSLA